MSFLESIRQSARGLRIDQNRGNSVYLLLYLGSIVLVLALWHGRVMHGISLLAVAALALVVVLCHGYGRWFIGLAPGLLRDGPSLALEFLSGYLLVNTLLFLLLVISPLAIAGNVALLALAALGLLWPLGRHRTTAGDVPRAARGKSSDQAPELIALLLTAVGATLWCADGLTPFVQDGSNTTFRLWVDSFVHARQIGAFMHSHGWATLSDLRMAGAPPYLYHYASYAVPAAVAAMTDAGAYETFASFQLPVGILLTGLAAFALGASIWGRWAGVAACVAVVLVPDAYQQGFGNKYLSYNFMQQVNVAGLYGVALAALAWIFMLRGCKTGNWRWILVAWLVALVTLAYKAHIFVANAFLIIIYPCIFLGGLKPRWRVPIAAGLIGCFVLVAAASQSIERVPTLRLDGSGAATYVSNLLWNYDPGSLKTFFTEGLQEPPWRPLRVAFYGATMIALSTFGFWSISPVVAVAWARKRISAETWLFPLLVMANYLVMALGLALDRNEIGSPDELLNRPLVWAYFAVAAWTGGAAYYALFGASAPRGKVVRVLAALTALLCVAGPWAFGSNLQTYPRWGGYATFQEYGSVPTCLVAASRFIRDHSAPADIVQDSENDPRVISKLALTALSERQQFVMLTPNRPPSGAEQRTQDIAAFNRLSDAEQITRFAASRRIAWYVLRPATKVSWPPAVRDTSVFECGGYHVYRFGP